MDYLLFSSENIDIPFFFFLNTKCFIQYKQSEPKNVYRDLDILGFT